MVQYFTISFENRLATDLKKPTPMIFFRFLNRFILTVISAYFLLTLIKYPIFIYEFFFDDLTEKIQLIRVKWSRFKFFLQFYFNAFKYFENDQIKIQSETHETRVWGSFQRRTKFKKKLNKIFSRYLDLVLTYKYSKVVIRCLEVEILNRKVDDWFDYIQKLYKSSPFPINISTSRHLMITFEYL